MIEKYESKQQRICKPADTIYDALSDFNNFTPIVADKVDDWSVDGDECAFRVKGFSMKLRMVEKVPGSVVKIESGDGSPLGFTFWIQMKEVGTSDTRIRLVLHAEMNMMIRMMVGSRIQPALDRIAEQMAQTFNAL